MIIDRLRSEAVHVQEPHASGITRLVTYAAQLKWLGGKFPIDVRSSFLDLEILNYSKLTGVPRSGWTFCGILRLASMHRDPVSLSFFLERVPRAWRFMISMNTANMDGLCFQFRRTTSASN